MGPLKGKRWIIDEFSMDFKLTWLESAPKLDSSERFGNAEGKLFIEKGKKKSQNDNKKKQTISCHKWKIQIDVKRQENDNNTNENKKQSNEWKPLKRQEGIISETKEERHNNSSPRPPSLLLLLLLLVRLGWQTPKIHIKSQQFIYLLVKSFQLINTKTAVFGSTGWLWLFGHVGFD